MLIQLVDNRKQKTAIKGPILASAFMLAVGFIASSLISKGFSHESSGEIPQGKMMVGSSCRVKLDRDGAVRRAQIYTNEGKLRYAFLPSDSIFAPPNEGIAATPRRTRNGSRYHPEGTMRVYAGSSKCQVDVSGVQYLAELVSVEVAP